MTKEYKLTFFSFSPSPSIGFFLLVYFFYFIRSLPVWRTCNKENEVNEKSKLVTEQTKLSVTIVDCFRRNNLPLSMFLLYFRKKEKMLKNSIFFHFSSIKWLSATEIDENGNETKLDNANAMKHWNTRKKWRR